MTLSHWLVCYPAMSVWRELSLAAIGADSALVAGMLHSGHRTALTCLLPPLPSQLYYTYHRSQSTDIEHRLVTRSPPASPSEDWQETSRPGVYWFSQDWAGSDPPPSCTFLSNMAADFWPGISLATCFTPSKRSQEIENWDEIEAELRLCGECMTVRVWRVTHEKLTRISQNSSTFKPDLPGSYQISTSRDGIQWWNITLWRLFSSSHHSLFFQVEFSWVLSIENFNWVPNSSQLTIYDFNSFIYLKTQRWQWSRPRISQTVGSVLSCSLQTLRNRF